MTPVFITGQDASTLAPLLTSLASSGLPAAQALVRDAQVTLGTWHQRVLASGQTQQPGRVWEQLAAELFVANIHQTQWAWADTQLIPLLNYWADFDPNIRFVLLAESPLHLALQAAANAPADALADPSDLLEHWAQTHRALLHFALRHAERCVLVWGQQARQAPQSLTQRMAQSWGLSLTTAPNAAAATGPTPCPLATHLGEQLCQSHPLAQQLLAELHACIEPLLPPAQATTTLLGRYRQLLQSSQDAPRLQSQLATLKKDLQTQSANASASELARTSAEAQAKQAETKVKTIEKEIATANLNLEEFASENTKIDAELRACLIKLHKSEEWLNIERRDNKELVHQLQDVMVELEKLHLQNKTLQEIIGPLKLLQQRWLKLFAQQPELYAVETVLIEPMPAHADRVRCQLGQLDMAGRHFDTLDLQLQIHPDGCAVLHLPRPPEDMGQGPLLRWPAQVLPGTSLALHPSLATDTSPQTVAAFMQLSSSDWRLVQDLHRLLLTVLAQPLPTLSPEVQHGLSTALQQSIDQLPAFAAMLRFDSATCPTLPTAQTLQLQLLNVSQNQQHTPSLALQLQQQSEQHFVLQLAPNAFTGDHSTDLDLTPAGWNNLQLATLTETQRHRLNLLLTHLPMALVDASLNGTDKEHLKPWARTASLLRQWTQNPQATALTPAPSSAAVKRAKPTATVQRVRKTKAPTLQPAATPVAAPSPTPITAPIHIHTAKAKRSARVSPHPVTLVTPIAPPVVTPAPVVTAKRSARQPTQRRKARA